MRCEDSVADANVVAKRSKTNKSFRYKRLQGSLLLGLPPVSLMGISHLKARNSLPNKLNYSSIARISLPWACSCLRMELFYDLSPPEALIADWLQYNVKHD